MSRWQAKVVRSCVSNTAGADIATVAACPQRCGACRRAPLLRLRHAMARQTRRRRASRPRNTCHHRNLYRDGSEVTRLLDPFSLLDGRAHRAPARCTILNAFSGFTPSKPRICARLSTSTGSTGPTRMVGKWGQLVSTNISPHAPPADRWATLWMFSAIRPGVFRMIFALHEGCKPHRTVAPHRHPAERRCICWWASMT